MNSDPGDTDSEVVDLVAKLYDVYRVLERNPKTTSHSLAEWALTPRGFITPAQYWAIKNMPDIPLP